jgi:hypothetical protein
MRLVLGVEQATGRLRQSAADRLPVFEAYTAAVGAGPQCDAPAKSLADRRDDRQVASIIGSSSTNRMRIVGASGSTAR